MTTCAIFVWPLNRVSASSYHPSLGNRVFLLGPLNCIRGTHNLTCAYSPTCKGKQLHVLTYTLLFVINCSPPSFRFRKKRILIPPTVGLTLSTGSEWFFRRCHSGRTVLSLTPLLSALNTVFNSHNLSVLFRRTWDIFKSRSFWTTLFILASAAAHRTTLRFYLL